MPDLAAAALLAVVIVAILAAAGRLRGVGREFASTARLAAAIFLLWAVIVAAVAMPAVLAAGAPGVATEELSFPALFAGHAILSAFLFTWWRLRRPTSLASFLHLRRAGRGDVSGGLLLGVRVWLITVAVAVAGGLLLQLLQLLAGGDPGATGEVPEIPAVMIWLIELPVAAKLLVILAAMTVEEAFFRAYLQTRIGLIPSSVLFAAAHASYGMPTLMVGVFVVSLVIGLDFARHHQLLRSILAHGVFDAAQLFVVVPFAVAELQKLQ